MEVSLANHTAGFRPWKLSKGRVFANVYALDVETTLIDRKRPWLTPAYVIGAVYDGLHGYFLTRENVPAFLDQHRDVPVVMHHAPFDLEVLDVVAPGFDIYKLVENNQVWDTQLLHQLHTLGSEGHTASGKDQATLEHCTELYLGVKLPKDVQDSEGRDVRTSYGRYLGDRPEAIEPVYLEYLAKDVMATRFVYGQLYERFSVLFQNSSRVWGYVSPEWLTEQMHRWGPQTHHIQLRAAIVLRTITANGLCVDLDRREELIRQFDEVLNDLRVELRRYGYLPGEKGSGKALQEILRRLEYRSPGLTLPKTATGLYRTDRETILESADIEPFLRHLSQYKEIDKLKNSFLVKMARARVHPSFNALMVSGRTSSFGELNGQNLPRDDRIRSCFVPSEGHVFLDADYSTLEMATLAQAVMGQFGVQSAMAEAINAGGDLHRLVAARVVGKPECEVTKSERQKAKPINFGKPGGMGHAGLQRYAKASYEVELNDDEVEDLSEAWFELFPEMDHYLYGSEVTDIGEEVARQFGLTPLDYFEQTGSRKFLNHPENVGHESQPHRILGWMCLKTLAVSDPHTNDGRAYLPEDVDYFWTRVLDRIDVLPPACHSAVNTRRPSLELRKAVVNVIDRTPCFTLTGRLRAAASFCARHNTVFQGLAADGAKLAMWQLWRGGYRIVNFIHDEFLIEIPIESDWCAHANRVKALMIQGMHDVVPNVRVDVEFAAADRWHKSAEAVFDDRGRLQLWYPPTDDDR